jgi:hypothetical protein
LVEVNEVDDGRERPRDGYYTDRNCVPWYARMSFGERAAVLWAADDDTGPSRHSLLQRFGVHSIYSRPIARLVNFRKIMSGKRVSGLAHSGLGVLSGHHGKRKACAPAPYPQLDAGNST